MQVTRLTLSNFRNYVKLDLSLPSGLMVIHGDNAQGKTNLLEAICILAFSRSPRAGKEGELLSWASDPLEPTATRIIGEVQRRDDSVTVEIALMAAAGRSNAPTEQAADEDEALFAVAPGVQKRIRINGLGKRAMDMLGTLRVVLFRPEDLALVTGAPSERRRALDMLLAQMDYRYPRSLQRYSRALQQRNHLLRRIAKEMAGVAELVPWDQVIATEGGYLLAQRYQALDRLGTLAAEAHARLSSSVEQLTVGYESTVPLDKTASPNAESFTNAILARLAAAQRRDIIIGQTTVGPHRDDLLFNIDRAPLGSYGSRGQQRTATLAWKLAEARYIREMTNDDPVVLLDDIFSEMDARRRSALLETVTGYQQVLLTTTGADVKDLDMEPAATYRVQAGQLSPG